MLEFIVLGYVPGTHFQITFSWVVTAALVLFGVPRFLQALVKQSRKLDAPTQNQA